MQAKYYIPEKLKGLVNVIWEQRAIKPMRWTFLPTGCVELIFRLGPALESVRGKTLNDEANPTRNLTFLSGLHTKPFTVQFTQFHFIGIQLQPIALYAIFGIPCSEVKDWALDGSLLIKNLNEPQIEERLQMKGGGHQKAHWLENFMVKRLKHATDLPFAMKLSDVVNQVLSKPSQWADIKLEDLTGYSRTHTYRLFKKWYGLSPSRTLKLQRYVRSLQQLHNDNLPENLTGLSYRQGYYDQAHFIHIFKEITGMTPGEYRKKRTAIPFQLKE